MIQFAAILVSVLFSNAAQAEDRFITLSSTTSTEDSGLFGGAVRKVVGIWCGAFSG
jgi:ABC-type tungstate transport system permease subunit